MFNNEESSLMMWWESRMQSFKDKPMSNIDDTGTSAAWGAAANLVNYTIGAGIVGLPYAMSMTGFGAGIMMYMLAAIMSYLGYVYCIESGIKMRELNFETLFTKLYGRWGAYNYTFTYCINAIGICTAYIIIIGDSITSLVEPIAPNSILADMQYTMIIITCVLLYPLSLVGNMHDLVWVSYISCASIFVMWVVTVFGSPFEGNMNEVSTNVDFIKPSFLKGLGTQAFAFSGTPASFIIYRSIKSPMLNTWAFVVIASMTFIIIMDMPLTLSGYLSFGEATEPDILRNFSSSWYGTIGRICLALNVGLTFPMPPTQTINTTLFIEILKMGDMTLPRYILIKTVNCAIPLGIVLITQDLGAIFNFIGSYSTCMTAFVFPALLYLAAYKVEFRDILNSWDNKSNTRPVTSIWGRICSLKNFYLPCLLLVYGGFIFVTGMISLSQ